MPTVHSSDGTPIHYEVEGTGPPVMLYHGLAASAAWWQVCGYVEALRDSFSVILIDDRAHGASGKRHKPSDLVMERRVDDVTAVLDVLDIEKVHFVGYSMGAVIGYGVARCAPERLASLVVGASSPYPSADPAASTAMAQAIREVGHNVFVDYIEGELGAIPDDIRRLVLSNDLDAVAGAQQALADDPGSVACLPGIDFPFLAYCGSADLLFERTRDGANEVPDGEFITLEGLNHMQAFVEPEAALAHIGPFLHRVAVG